MRALLFVILCAALPSVRATAEEETTRADGAHFAVVAHFETEDLAAEALQQIEKLWKPASVLYGLAQGAERKKLVVHLYRDAQDYEVAEERITGGRFRRNLAFAHFDTRTAHVALQPDLCDEALAALGLPDLTRSLLLHEAAHLIRYRSMGNHRDHPSWFADGAAMWIKHHVLAPDGPDDAPLSSSLTVRGQRLLAQEKLPTVAQILADDMGALAFYDRYALRGLFFRFLQATYAEEIVAVIRKTRRLGGGHRLPARMTQLLADQLGPKRFAGLDADFATFLASLKPAWEEVHRSLGADAGKRVQIAFPGTNAVAWRTTPIDGAKVGKASYEISATVEILRNTSHQMNLLLDRSDTGLLSVALTADFGVTLFEYTSKTKAWNNIQAVKHADVVVGKPFQVSVKVAGGTVRVSINGAEVVSGTFPARKLSGPYGLGAQAGTAGIWNDLRVR